MSKNVIRIDPIQPLPRIEKVGIYCRVSSTKAEQISSLQAQASYLLQYALAHRDWNVGDIYIEIASGSSIEKRPEFMRMLSDIARGKITLALTKNVSRFGRNAEEALTAFRAIKAAGGKVFFEQEGLDSNNSESEFYITVYSAYAEGGNTSHSESIKWGIWKRAEDGTSALFNRPCYGYRVNEDGVFEIVPDQAAVVRDIFSLYIHGLSVVKIIKYLESRDVPSPTGKPTWSKHTIETILENKKYIGTSQVYKSFQYGHPESKTVINRGQHKFVEVSEHHIPIITEQIFEAAQEARKARTNIERDEDGNPRRKATRFSTNRDALGSRE